MHLSYACRREAAAAPLLLTICGTCMTPRGSHHNTTQTMSSTKKKAEPKFRLLSRAAAYAYGAVIRRVYLWMKLPV